MTALVQAARQLRHDDKMQQFVPVEALFKGNAGAVPECDYMDVCFIADDTLEKLPTASRVGKTRVGGVDFNRPRMRAVAHAVIALATSPKGFTASQLAQKVATLSHPLQARYGPRHAAYDVKKLRGKKLVEKIASSHRYQPTPQGLRALTALMALRDKVIKPLLASSCQLKRGPKPRNTTLLDQHYQRLQAGMQDLFGDLGIAA